LTSLLHSAGQLGRIVPLEARKADELDEIIRTLLHLGFIEPLLQFHAVPDITRNRAPRQQAGVLKDDCAIDSGAEDFLSIDQYIAFFVGQQPAMMFSIDVFPQPLGPTMAMNSPSSTENDTSDRARTLRSSRSTQ
jgi:hypothetical protein